MLQAAHKRLIRFAGKEKQRPVWTLF